MGGKTGDLDHLPPIFVDHHIFLTIYKGRWQVAPMKTDQGKRLFHTAHLSKPG